MGRASKLAGFVTSISDPKSSLNIVNLNVSGIATLPGGSGGGIGTEGSINTSGIITATEFHGDGSNLTNVIATGLATDASINTTGIITASEFHGDGSNLTGVGTTDATLGERLSSDQDSPAYKIFKQKKVLDIDETLTVNVGADFDSVAYVAEADIRVAVGETFTIGAGVTFKTNILGVFPQ